MSVAEKITPDIPPEFTPDVVILANDLERFSGFAAFLQKNGFACQVFNSVEFSQFENTKPDTIFYISFNFSGANPITLAQDLEQRLGMTCIVFAESDDFQTAAKLSSAKMTQTLQHPYTQKNFLMGLQTIVKKRKAEYEKEKRRQSHHRQEQQQKTVTDGGVIVQKGIAQEASSATVIQGETKPSISIVQEGIKTETKVAVIAGEKTQSHTIVQHANPLTRKSRQFNALEEEKATPARQPRPLSSNESQDTPQSVVAEPSVKDVARVAVATPSQVIEETQSAPKQGKAEFDWEGLQQSMDQQFMDHKWAIFGVSLLGILICCYCLYQMILMGH